MEKTRSAVRCPLFGEMCQLKENVLPTYEDVMKYWEWTRYELKRKMEKPKEPIFLSIAEIVACDIEKIWEKASLPTVSHTRIIQMLRAYHMKCKNLIKSIKRLTEEKRQEFLEDSRVLFDISSCKCKSFDLCNCAKEKKVPKAEQIFLTDQRTLRKMAIGGIDVRYTKTLKKRAERSVKAQNISQQISTQPSLPKKPRRVLPSRYSQSNETMPFSDETHLEKKKITTLSTLAITCDRYGVSDRAAAAIASSVLHDIEANVEVIDRHKIRRDRFKMREKSENESRECILSSLYFDGRKDRTLKIITKSGRNYRTTIVEEHISLIKEPESVYLGYVVPVSGTARSTLAAITNYLSDKNISVNNLSVMGCDGTNVNTGKHGGIIRLMEKQLGRPLQWIICLLHMNELPLRHLFLHLDGSTSGPRSFTGQLGKLLENCEQIPVLAFEKIQGTQLPPASDLSADQAYLHNIVSAVISGEFPEALGHKSPGKLSHARWLTRANRILRLYVATKTPPQNLTILATFVVKVYAPVWFAIKNAPSCNHAALHFFEAVARSRYLPEDIKKVVDPVLQRNSYAVHPENLLLAMLTDKRKEVRELAIKKILNARKAILPSMPRVFEVPEIKLNAVSYTELINWDTDQITAPPILQNLSDDEIISTFQEWNNSPRNFLAVLPSHTQAVERAVKITTEASLSVCSKKEREGLIKTKIKSRKIMPKFETKRDFQAD